MNIYLFCSGGFSTSLLAKRMEDAYHKRNQNDVHVEAFDYGSIEDVGNEADVILLGPQISWAKSEVVANYPNAKVYVMTIQEFGSMDGSKMIEKIDKLEGE